MTCAHQVICWSVLVLGLLVLYGILNPSSNPMSRSRIQNRIRRDKKNYVREECRVLEEHDKKGRTEELHQQIREISGKPKINTGSLKSRAGIDYIEKDKIIRRWKENTEDFYKKDLNTSINFQEKTYTQEPLVIKSKVRKVLREITGNKTTGIDKLPIELIKAAGEA